MHNPLEHPTQRSDMRGSTIHIDDYLDRLCAPLIDRMSYEQRIAIREEVRAHLLVLAAGHEELGSSPAEALQAAMEQFGDANQIGRSLSREYPKPFEVNPQIPWVLLHAAIGGAFGSLAFVAMDLTLKQQHLVSCTEVPLDCLVGFAMGWLPAVKLLKRPAAPLRAGLITAGFYSAVIAGLLAFTNGLSAKWFDHGTCVVLTSLGISGMLSGGAMSLLFRRLKRFAPRSRAQIAR